LSIFDFIKNSRKKIKIKIKIQEDTHSGGTRGRLAGARAPARKFFPASPFVK